jgi:hypothetical protein
VNNTELSGEYQDGTLAVTVNTVVSTTVFTLASVAGISVGDVFYQSTWAGIITAVNSGTSRITINSAPSTPVTTGAALVALGYQVTLEWAWQHGGVPGVGKHFKEARIHFGKANLYDFDGTFKTDRDTSSTSVALGAVTPNPQAWTYTVGAVPTNPKVARMYLPRDQQRANLVKVGLSIRESNAVWSIWGYSLEVDGVSQRTER